MTGADAKCPMRRNTTTLCAPHPTPYPSHSPSPNEQQLEAVVGVSTQLLLVHQPASELVYLKVQLTQLTHL